jgi:hypothetical protein
VPPVVLKDGAAVGVGAVFVATKAVERGHDGPSSSHVCPDDGLREKIILRRLSGAGIGDVDGDDDSENCPVGDVPADAPDTPAVSSAAMDVDMLDEVCESPLLLFCSCFTFLGLHYFPVIPMIYA